jgi:hypothetical protein
MEEAMFGLEAKVAAGDESSEEGRLKVKSEVEIKVEVAADVKFRAGVDANGI